MPQDNRLIIALGAALAIVAGLVIAFLLTGGRDEAPEAPATTKGGLQLDVADAPALEPTQALRCYVNGQFVGMATLADCAQRNGVATNALDVGVDDAGNLTAAEFAAFDPPPTLPYDIAGLDPYEFEEPGVTGSPDVSRPAPPRPSGPGAPCLSFVRDSWRELSGSTTLNACVQALFSGECLSPGQARYGRWGNTTLRLVPRRIEQSPNNQDFRTLTEQNRNCSIPQVN